MLNAQGVQPQALEVKDFSGGMTDNYIAAGPSYFQLADNFLIGDDKKLITRPGLLVDDEANARVPTDKRINTQFDDQAQDFLVSNKKLYRYGSGFTEVVGPSSNSAFSAGDEYSFVAKTKWNKHVFLGNSDLSYPLKLFKDGGTWKLHELGLPALGGTPSGAGTAGADTYLYAFHYYYQYTSQGVTFEEVGPVLDGIAVANVNAPNVNNITISNIPVIANGVTRHYDVTNIKCKVFRTAPAGSVYYYVGEVTNGTTTFVDAVSNTTLQENATIYITGDIPDHVAAPRAKFIHSVNDILCLGYVIENDGVTYPNKLRFSNRFQPWSCPEEFAEEFDEEIKGISSVNIYPIVFCDKKVYRIEGFYLPNGSGQVQKKLISENAGCVSARSIVQTEHGVFWAGNDGFYFTDGTRVTRVSELFNRTYNTMTATDNQKNRIYGMYNPLLQSIYWCMQEDTDTNTDNDTIFVAHLRFGINPELPFTTLSGGVNFAPTCLHYKNGTVYHCDSRGYVLRYDDDTLTDPKIDTGTAASDWLETAIIYDYRSSAFDFGLGALRKWVPAIVVHADNVSSISLMVSSNNDNGGDFKELREIHYAGNVAWGEYDIPWGDPNLRWNYFPIISAKRFFPAGGLRCSYKQVRFTNAYSEIATSADITTATFNNTTNTAVLDSGSLTWPSDVLDYYISEATDNYEAQYRITARTDTTLTLEDATNTLPTGSKAWKIYGYRRQEILKLISYSIQYGLTSPSQEPYRVTS